MIQHLKNIKGIMNAFLYSLAGLKFLLKERAFVQELGLGFILIIIECFKNTSTQLLLYIFSSYVFILITEAINTSIEALVDRISLEKHELSKKAKDIGSATVFIALCHFFIVWIYSFFN